MAIGFSSLWVSGGYAHALARNPNDGARNEFPLGIGADIRQDNWQLSLAGRVVVASADRTTYGVNGTFRWRF